MTRRKNNTAPFDISASIASITNKKTQVAIITRDALKVNVFPSPKRSPECNKILTLPSNNDKTDAKPLKLVSSLRGKAKGNLQAKRSNITKNNQFKVNEN